MFFLFYTPFLQLTKTDRLYETYPIFHCENKEKQGLLRLGESGAYLGNLRKTGRE